MKANSVKNTFIKLEETRDIRVSFNWCYCLRESDDDLSKIGRQRFEFDYKKGMAAYWEPKLTKSRPISLISFDMVQNIIESEIR